jgi:glycosyltransferase involved in cell wall biosynthesis
MGRFEPEVQDSAHVLTKRTKAVERIDRSSASTPSSSVSAVATSGNGSTVSARAGAAELFASDPAGNAGRTLLDPTNPEELAAKLENWIQDKGSRSRASVAARQLAEGYSWDRVADRYADALDRLCSR